MARFAFSVRRGGRIRREVTESHTPDPKGSVDFRAVEKEGENIEKLRETIVDGDGGCTSCTENQKESTDPLGSGV